MIKNMKIKNLIQLSSVLFIAISLFFIFSTPKDAQCQELNSTELPSVELFQEKDFSSIPGEVQYIGEEKTEPVSIKVIKYNDNFLEEKEVDSATAAKALIEDGFVTWIDVNGVHDEEKIEEFGTVFELFPSVQEDIANTSILPYIMDDSDYIFLTLKMLNKDFGIDSAKIEQISLVLGNNYLISFQENNDNDFSEIYERLIKKRGNISKMGSDYLAFVLIDVITDSYFPAINVINEQINNIEKQLIDSPNEELLENIYIIKRELTVGRQVINPMREIIYNLSNYNYPLISLEVKEYFHITYENIEYLNNIIETYTNITSDMVNYYISIYGHRTKTILKFLTIITSILFVLSFVAAVYGMDLSQFHSKHKLKRGHIIVLLIMAALSLIALIYFLFAGWM